MCVATTSRVCSAQREGVRASVAMIRGREPARLSLAVQSVRGVWIDRGGHSDTGVMHASTGLEVRKKPAHVVMGEGPGDSLWSDATVGCWQARAMNQHGHEGRDAQQSEL